MNERKYNCPHCGQHIAYTEAYSGLQVPCPRCQTAIIFPGLAAPRQTSALHLARPIAPPKARFNFSFAGIVEVLKKFKHWKIAAMCAVPFVVVAGALVAASVSNRHATPSVVTTVSNETPVDAHALDKLTDLTRADQLVQDRMAVVLTANADCQAEVKKHQAARSLRPSPAALQAMDQAEARARQKVTAARKAFDEAFAQYQKLGGTVDYRQQLQ